MQPIHYIRFTHSKLMSPAQTLSRYSFPLVPHKDRTIWTNTAKMGKKKGKLALATQQQAQESQNSDSKLKNEQPFVGQALLDALEMPKQDATTQAVKARSSSPLAPAAGVLLTKTWEASHGRPLKPLPPKPIPAPTTTQSQFDAATGERKQPPWRASRQNQSGGAQKNQYNQYPQASYPQSSYPQAPYPQTLWQQSSYGPAPGGGVWLHPEPLQDILTQWKLSDSPPEGSKLQDSIAYDSLRYIRLHHSNKSWRIDKRNRLHFTPSHSTPSGLTSINRPAMINEPALHRNSPAPKASPAPRASLNPRNSPAPPGGKRHPSPKIHLPAPMPTEDYLNRAAKIPERLDRPQRPLLVLDLNGTLVYRPDRDSTRAISRPFLQSFLKYIFENFYVMVWSSAKPYNVSRMVNAVLTSEQHALLIAQWGRDKFDLTPDQYTQNVQVYKELSRIWAEAKTTCLHPQHNQGQLWGQHNTILLDDSEIKASSEPFNLIQIPEFVASEEQMHGDVLREVAGYLDEVRMQNDVSAFMKRTPFKADGRWNMEWPDVPEGVAIAA